MVWFGAVHGYKVSFRTLVKATAVLFPITVAMRLFDTAFAAAPLKFNYMFLISPPDVSTPLDSFGHGWGYYFAFVALCLGVFVVAWLPWGIAGAIRARSSRPRPGRG